VVQTSFDHVPTSLFKSRQLVLCGIVFLCFLLGVGLVAGYPLFINDLGIGKTGRHLSVLTTGLRFYSELFFSLSHLPQACVGGGTVNTLQVRQCEDFWFLLMVRGALSFIPFVVSSMVYKFGFFNLRRVYQRARSKASLGKPDLTAKVIATESSAGGETGDLFGWYFGFQTVVVESPNKQRLTVYLSAETGEPRLGETLLVFEIGMIWAQTRRVAVLYAPHIAVVRGA
jgi:hypothetical protein